MFESLGAVTLGIITILTGISFIIWGALVSSFWYMILVGILLIILPIIVLIVSAAN